ncbi:MAG TPA: hypothetical protein VGX70_00520 [Gemmataceae bacterium]|nr:hypothetical protein [Gemmataceae bacterium]
MFDFRSGKELWNFPEVYAAYPRIDSTSTVISFIGKDGKNYHLDITSKALEIVHVHSRCLGPKGDYWCANPPGVPAPPGLSLYRRGKAEPLVTLGLESYDFRFSQFNRDGTHVAWGNRDGTVTVCDLPEINRRLREVGLNWEP